MNASTARSAFRSARKRQFFAEEDVPEDQQEYIQINAELSKQWPSITRKKPAPDDWEKWSGVPNKLQYLKR